MFPIVLQVMDIDLQIDNFALIFYCLSSELVLHNA